MYERFLSEPIPATIGRGKRFKRRLKKIYLRLPMRPLVRFVYAYVLRLGFLDGKPGPGLLHAAGVLRLPGLGQRLRAACTGMAADGDWNTE